MKTEVRYICGDEIKVRPESVAHISCSCKNITNNTIKIGSLSSFDLEDDDGDFIERRIEINWGYFCNDCALKIIAFIESLKKGKKDEGYNGFGKVQTNDQKA